MDESKHDKERSEDIKAAEKVASIHNFDFSFIKWVLGGIGCLCVIFLGVLGWNLSKTFDLASQVAGVVQWQNIYGKRIDDVLQTKTIYVPMQLPKSLNMAKATSTALDIDP